MTPIPNLGWYFKIHKNVAGIFYFVYKYIDTCSIYPTKYEEHWKKLWMVVRSIHYIKNINLAMISANFWNQIIENSREYGNLKIRCYPTPNLTLMFETNKNVGYNVHKVWRILKDIFDDRPTCPTCPIKLGPSGIT